VVQSCGFPDVQEYHSFSRLTKFICTVIYVTHITKVALTTLLCTDVFTVSLTIQGTLQQKAATFIILAHGTDQSDGSAYRKGSIPIAETLKCSPTLAVILLLQ
jgi:hypothetical protein